MPLTAGNRPQAFFAPVRRFYDTEQEKTAAAK